MGKPDPYTVDIPARRKDTGDLVIARFAKSQFVIFGAVAAAIAFAGTWFFATKGELAAEQKAQEATRGEINVIKVQVDNLKENSRKVDRKVEVIDDNIRRLMRRQRVRALPKPREDDNE